MAAPIGEEFGPPHMRSSCKNGFAKHGIQRMWEFCCNSYVCSNLQFSRMWEIQLLSGLRPSLYSSDTLLSDAVFYCKICAKSLRPNDQKQSLGDC